jgi:adenosylcobinamide-GDP ribazoletransferase
VRAAFAFLTALGGARRPGPRTLDWFPLVGAVLGAALGVGWWVSEKIWPPLLSAGVVVVADLALTGMLHFDGLVDCADGLLPHMARDRRLSVMSTPDAGAFGLAAGASVVLLRWGALSSMHASVLLISGLWTLSRTTMAVVARSVPYARQSGGLASAFQGPFRPLPLAAGGLAALGLLLGWRLGAGWAVFFASLAGSLAVVALAQRRIGGYTGDVLGALGMVGETTGLLIAAAKW